MTRRDPSVDLSRRSALALIAVSATGGAFLSAVARAQSTNPALMSPDLLKTAGICTITPELTEGPYYFDPKLDRSDITEGHEGAALTIRLQVVDAGCKPVRDARVDIWHCNAHGHYSGYPGQGDGQDFDTSGETFLRGWQTTDTTGVATFRTIYPGWYRGRTTHVHFKVFLADDTVLTGQMFFPDDVSERIYANVGPYNERTAKRDTLNTDDGILRRAGASVEAALSDNGQAWSAELIVGVAVI